MILNNDLLSSEMTIVYDSELRPSVFQNNDLLPFWTTTVYGSE